LRISLAVGLLLVLSGCASERHFAAHSLWPFGNPNAPATASETAQRALGHDVTLAPLQPQPGDVWPGPVQPMPTLSQVQKYSNLPLGQGYTPSLPSPYPPGEEPKDNGKSESPTDGQLYNTVNGAPQAVPAVPGDAR
jgi:hypothetical protein